MAEHEAKVVNVQKVANAVLAFVARCCGDPGTDKVLTLYFHEDVTDEDIDRKVQQHLRAAEALHAAADRVAAVLAKYRAKQEER